MDSLIIDNTAEDLEEELRRVQGVLDVEIAGNLERKVIIEIDPVKLSYYNLSMDDVSGAVQIANAAILGVFLKARRTYSIAINSKSAPGTI